MVIHSVTPLYMLQPECKFPPCVTMQVDGNLIEGYQSENGFQLSRLYSTDPAMYLKKEYFPGSYYNCK